ncbi:hypothetical protein [Pengzhenrongella sicca]|uniref:Uncharacterized protein n=1 Tax=Pengzhenrongella sicca TaxID=2819238 RepID=A0A8A4ZEV8_9MICO|nr:hypothetical protein [Pengzhenrongella sicca]QTE30434.1 hypothetical protein J4E96_05440 [Pengzhenrongella sicca]
MSAVELLAIRAAASPTSALRRGRAPFGRDLADAARRGRAVAYIAARELRYLAGVGALDHLREPAARLGVQVGPVEAGLVLAPTSPRGTALAVYADAEVAALAAIDGLSLGQRATVAARLADDLTLCRERRVVLLGNGLRVPARGGWLAPG